MALKIVLQHLDCIGPKPAQETCYCKDELENIQSVVSVRAHRMEGQWLPLVPWVLICTSGPHPAGSAAPAGLGFSTVAQACP